MNRQQVQILAAAAGVVVVAIALGLWLYPAETATFLVIGFVGLMGWSDAQRNIERNAAKKRREEDEFRRRVHDAIGGNSHE